MRLLQRVFVTAAVLIAALNAAAIPYSAVIVYGDSLSDSGNLYAATSNTVPPDPPYYQGRRSNGPVAVERLAALHGAPLLDFAWIGATTGIGNYADGGTPTAFGAFGLPGMQAQFAATSPLLAAQPAAFRSRALYVVWGGPNDLLAPAAEDGGDFNAILGRAIANEVGIITGLQALGARDILVPGMPDLGSTPYFRGLGANVAAGASILTQSFNDALRAITAPLGVQYFDTAAVLARITSHPEAYGLTNVTDPCFDSEAAMPGPACTDPEHYLFFDSFHPSAAAHRIVGDAFHAATVPAPVGMPMLAAVLLALVAGGQAVRRRGLRLHAI